MEIEINEKDQIKKTIKELENRLEELAEGGERAQAKGREYAQMLKARGRQIYEKAKDTGEKVNEYAKEHPWTLMGIGAALGAIAGSMISASACRRRHC